MLKRISIAAAAFAVAGVVLLALSPLGAVAAPPPPSAGPDQRGTITASGGNMAAVTGLINLDASGMNGVLLVKDQDGGATVKTDGTPNRANWFGFTVYTGVHTATVTGANVGVILVSQRLDLHVTGRGLAHFRGTGTYNGSTGRGAWSSGGSAVALGPAAAGR